MWKPTDRRGSCVCVRARARAHSRAHLHVLSQTTKTTHTGICAPRTSLTLNARPKCRAIYVFYQGTQRTTLKHTLHSNTRMRWHEPKLAAPHSTPHTHAKHTTTRRQLPEYLAAQCSENPARRPMLCCAAPHHCKPQLRTQGTSCLWHRLEWQAAQRFLRYLNPDVT